MLLKEAEGFFFLCDVLSAASLVLGGRCGREEDEG